MNLKVKEIFRSIQGEGPFMGRPAIFIRLSGCNLSCSFCDEHHDTGALMDITDIMSTVNSIKTTFPLIRLVVITGGEPFLQPFGPLVKALRAEEFVVQIETNGTVYQEDFPYEDVVIVCSPKTDINRDLLPQIHSLKFLIAEGQEINPCPDPGLVWYLQPLDVNDPDQNRRNMVWAARRCMDSGYILSLQMHKIVGLR